MPLEKYKAADLFYNSNFLEETSEAGTKGYRGDLVIVQGELDDKGHHMPPISVMRGAVLLGSDKLKMMIGNLDQAEQLPDLVEKYKEDFAPDMKSMLFVVNIKDPAQVELEGITFTLIPLVQGVAWNEAIDELALEKSDFKGQSSADKIMTVYKEMLSYKPKYPKVELDEVLANTTEAVREGWGAV
jgi:hypothetical protein